MDRNPWDRVTSREVTVSRGYAGWSGDYSITKGSD